MTEYPLPNVSHELSGQNAFVTGATSGLGRRFAEVLANAGAHVVITGRRVERLDELAAEITAAGGHATPYALDMTDQAAIVDVVERAWSDVGPLHILVNNAGVPDAQRAHKMELDLVNLVFDTNLVGPWILSTEIAKRLIADKLPGRQVNISSIGAFRYSGQGAALYSVTKMGIARMAEVLAVEWARYGINVNAIAPGAFESEMMDGMLSRMGDITEHFPRKRLGAQAQLDSTLLYLCSPASDAVTGTVIKVDDGQGPR
ncbi:MAG: SDR family NAD(P)-dependent oxidoreductase [Actinomycetota bacterium]